MNKTANDLRDEAQGWIEKRDRAENELKLLSDKIIDSYSVNRGKVLKKIGGRKKIVFSRVELNPFMFASHFYGYVIQNGSIGNNETGPYFNGDYEHINTARFDIDN